MRVVIVIDVLRKEAAVSSYHTTHKNSRRGDDPEGASNKVGYADFAVFRATIILLPDHLLPREARALLSTTAPHQVCSLVLQHASSYRQTSLV